ncbi:DNA-binding transcriptional LysR family regulator [Streptomyces sp. Ag109_G2-6]|uniref:LysR substrate-binding domain-containing protein n=1 Tax=Streptomyces TaxID=1883 RepID=UPI0009A4EDBF|nr:MULTISPECIES: LysR substrate-binding domain-containing protein [Streptomyces]RPF44081.1 DNA-binding transcriptional LysR family regulator [Streptomyces sp. Ag109_G2-6]
MLDVRRLRLLRELARRGTIAAVAEALAYSPSAVSQQLAVLEREAGLPLLERTGRRVRLTPAAQNLVGHAEAVLKRLEQADAELAEARSGLAGVLRIGAFPTATRALVPAALLHLARRHPALEPMVHETDPAAVAHALRAGELDVALVHEYDFVPAPPEPGLDTRPLYGEAMYLAAPATTARPGPQPEPAPGAAPAPEADTHPRPDPAPAPAAPAPAPDQGAVLRAHRDAPWITATPGTLCHAMTLRACQAAGFTPRVRHRIDEFATVLALVAAGQGVAVVPQLGMTGPPDPAVALTRLHMERRTKIAFRSGAGAHPAVAAFAASLRAAVPRDLAESPAGG